MHHILARSVLLDIFLIFSSYTWKRLFQNFFLTWASDFQAFGLHPNADITYQTKTAVDVLDTIVNIQPKDSSTGGGETRESVVARQATEMLEKLPDDYISHEVFCLYSLIGFVKLKQHEI